MDSRSAARILDLAEPRGSRRRAVAAFAVILAIAAHVAAAGGFPSSAPTAGSSPGRAAHLAAEQAHMKRLMAVGAVAISASAGALAQEAVQWRVEDGGNGHWYRTVAGIPNLVWSEANGIATSAGGHLVTFGSAAESAFVVTLVNQSSATLCPLGPWIGLVQDRNAPTYAEPGGGWRWIDDTDAAVNWQAPLSPNNDCFGVAEDYANMTFDGKVNDLAADPSCVGYWPNGAINSLVIEWSADCNSDGIVDFGQIRAGELDDANGNNIPDCCENGTLCGCPGDANDDGAVDGIDLAIVLTRWGQPGAKFPEADCNDDGAIDGVDLSLVLGTWGACP